MASYTILLFLYVCTRINVQGALTVVLHKPAFAILGGKFEFNCTVEGDSAAAVESFKWYHNDSIIIMDEQNLRISTVMKSQWYSTLVVTAAQRGDGGEYHCEAVFADMNETAQTSNRITLKIQGVFSVNITPLYEVVLGSSIKLKCTVDANPIPTLTWSRVVNGAVSRNVISQNPGDPNYGCLNMTVTQDDDGDWRCAASSTFGGGHSDFLITVIVPPANTSVSLMTDKPIQKDRDFQLKCNSSVNHYPKFTWIRDGTNLTKIAVQAPNSRFVVDSMLGHLTVKEATYEDSGVYSCIATNKAGSEWANLTVDIEGAPEILFHQSSPQNIIKMSKVSGGYLSCPYLSHPPPTSVEWRKGSNVVQSGEQYQIFSDNGTLLISSLESTESKLVTFTCHVVNKYGSDNRTFNMLVIDVPEPPGNFTITLCENNDHAIVMNWTTSMEANFSEEVEGYILEQSINGEKFKLSKEVFDANATSGVLSGLLSGVTYNFRLRARNLAGLSQPSNNQTCTIQASSPEDGVSVCDCAYEEYYIIGAVVGGVLMVTMVIMFIVFAYGKHRYKRRKKTHKVEELEKKSDSKDDQLFKIISNTSNLQMYTV